MSESRRDGIYGNNGLQSVGRDKGLMLTRANPIGMRHIVAMDFSPLAVRRSCYKKHKIIE